jgi:AcrR family transcriptional regulator
LAARPRQISDDDILKVACECFLENGPVVSVQVIADRLGISQPTLFKRFNTKEELLVAALMPKPDSLPVLNWLKDEPNPGPFLPQLEILISMLWKTIEIVFPKVSMLAMCGIPHRQIQSRIDKIPLLLVLEKVADWIAAAQRQGHIRKDGDPIIWAQMCMGPLQGRAALKFILHANLDDETDSRYRQFKNDKLFVRSTAEQLWRGMSDADVPTPK